MQTGIGGVRVLWRPYHGVGLLRVRPRVGYAGRGGKVTGEQEQGGAPPLPARPPVRPVRRPPRLSARRPHPVPGCSGAS